MNFLGIDIGTSSVKVIVTSPAGDVLASTSAHYPLHQPHPNWSEQDPVDWWRGTQSAILALGPLASTISAIGLSGQMHGLVLLDDAAIAAKGTNPATLRRALLWNDQRTSDQCATIEHALGGRAACVRAVGNAPLPGFTLPKLLWVRDHEPDLFRRAAVFLLPKDYIRFLMTGQLATDVGDASGTLLFNPATRDWNLAAAAAVNIPSSLLPPVLESGDIAGRLTPHAAAALGVPPNIPVVAGSGDNMMGAIGAGVVSPGMAALTIGTSGVLYTHSDSLKLDLPITGPAGRVHSMCAATGRSHAPRGWCITGCSLSSGGSLAWAKDTLWPEVPYDQLLAEAASAPAGSDGLVFLPYLTGERCPHPDPFARAGWIGLTSRHTRAHLVRSILEGVAATLATIVDIQRKAGVTITRFRIGGGGAKSPLWRQILADSINEPLHLPNTEEGPAFGAALLAQSTTESSESIASLCARTIKESSTTLPLNPAPYPDVKLAIAQAYDALKQHTALML